MRLHGVYSYRGQLYFKHLMMLNESHYRLHKLVRNYLSSYSVKYSPCRKTVKIKAVGVNAVCILCYSDNIVSDYGLDDRAIEVRSPTGAEDFSSSPASRPALGPTQPPIQWVPGVLSPGVKRGRGVTLTTRPHLVPRLRTSRSYTSSPPMCLHGV
jgi:hypothetical protein